MTEDHTPTSPDARWTIDSSRYDRGAEPVSRPQGTPVPAPRSAAHAELVKAQRELTGVSWRVEDVDLDQIHARPVSEARARFRAVLPDLVWNAAALEGNTITLPEVRTLLDGTTVAGHRVEEAEQVLALAEAYNTLDALVGTGTFRLDKATSDRLHGIVARHEAIEAGSFRGEGVATGGGAVRLAAGGIVDGVPASELPARWDSLMDYLSDPSAGMADARLRALVYNASATRTQFYFDGNKRTARLMMVGELMSHGFDAVNIPHSRRLEYNIALDEMFTTDDATTLMRFTASCAPRS